MPFRTRTVSTTLGPPNREVVPVPCPSCGTENRPDRKFCSNCGSPLAVACPSCGATNLPGERFCGECGSALLAGGEAVRPTVAPADAPVPVEKWMYPSAKSIGAPSKTPVASAARHCARVAIL